MCVWEICHPERSKESREHPCKRICVCHRRYIVPIIYHVGMQCAAFFYDLLYHQVKERLLSGCFPFANAKIELFFQTLVLNTEGKTPKWNEWNEKVIFTGTNGIISSVIPSPIRWTEGKFPRAKDTEWVYVKTHTDGKWQKWQMAVYSKGKKNR